MPNPIWICAVRVLFLIIENRTKKRMIPMQAEIDDRLKVRIYKCEGQAFKKFAHFLNLKPNKMKKRSSILIMAIVLTSFILSSCGGSVKGKWSKADKEKFTKEMDKADLSGFGENKAKWIDCYYSKVEANYSSFDEANKDTVDTQKFATECSDIIAANGSVKGKWSDADKAKLKKLMEGSEAVSKLGEDKAKWVDCYLSKLEAKYSSFSEADKDEKGASDIALECNAEIAK